MRTFCSDTLVKAKLLQKGAEIAEVQLQNVTQQMETFKASLEEFAAKYKSEIKKNPEFRFDFSFFISDYPCKIICYPLFFRTKFQTMCARIGVDPLASSKGFWAQLLGVGDFYYELGVQIIEVTFNLSVIIIINLLDIDKCVSRSNSS